MNEITDIDETTGPTWTTPAYSSTGNMTTIPQPADPTKSFSATWDAWNRLTKLVDDSNSNTIAEYEYDGSNRRIVIKNYTSGTLSDTRHDYLSEEWQTLEERLDSSTNANTQHIWGQRYIDECVLRDRDTNNNGTLNERLYALQDANWNVTALTNTNGTIQQRFAYEPYGESVTLDTNFTTTTDAYDWTYRFTGRELNFRSLLFYFRNRFFSINTGTFITRDQAGYLSGSNLNSCFSVPNETDPSGLLPCIIAQVPNGSIGPPDLPSCSTFNWLSGRCCTLRQAKAARNCCQSKGERLLGCNRLTSCLFPKHSFIFTCGDKGVCCVYDCGPSGKHEQQAEFVADCDDELFVEFPGFITVKCTFMRQYAGKCEGRF